MSDPLVAVLEAHKPVIFLTGLPDPEGWDRDGYQCACGGIFGERRWSPRQGRRGAREPVIVNTKADHVAAAVRDFLTEEPA